MRRKTTLILPVLFLLILGALEAWPQSRGVDSIRGAEMKRHLSFLASPDFRGRETPSLEADIAARYIALTAQHIGLKPLLPEGYLQAIPVEETSVIERGSFLRVKTAQGEQVFQFPEAFGPGRLYRPGKIEGNVVFLGFGLEAPQLNWSDYAGIDVRGKIVVLLDTELPKEHVLKPEEHRREIRARLATPILRGAAAVVTVIDESRDEQMAETAAGFEPGRTHDFIGVDAGFGSAAARGAMAPVYINVRHDAAAAILGIGREDILRLMEDIRKGVRPEAREVPGASLEISLAVARRKVKTANVVGWIEGSDPELKNEYVVDRLPLRSSGAQGREDPSRRR